MKQGNSGATVDFEAVSSLESPDALTFFIESKVPRPGSVTQRIRFNFATGLFETVDTGPASFTDELIEV